jgi:hypothetical protein
MTTSAWIGNWYERIKGRARERGFATVTEFAATQPTASLLVLADQLSKGNDVAAAQLEKVLLHEAEEADAMEHCAKNLLVRRLHEKLPEGWPAEWNRDATIRRASAYGAWAAALGERYQPSYRAIGDTLKAAAVDTTLIPSGWLPEGPDDPILVAIFQQHWREHEQEDASEE